MKRWSLIGLSLIVLAFLVPLSSRRPDSVQHLLGLSGGTESAARALVGILVAFAAMTAVVWILKHFAKRK